MTKRILSLLVIFTVVGYVNAQDWATSVAQIFYSRCTSCHHPGGAGPFSLLDYNTAYTYRYVIKQYVNDGLMPPWPPDTNYSRFVHERILTQSEAQSIINWVNNGAPQGDPNQAPAPPVYSGQYQLSGTPDLVIKMPAYTSNAVSNDEYVCFSIPSNLTVDRYVRAVEIVPGNPQIVHHVLLFADSSNSMPPGSYQNCFTGGDIGIGGYAPGSSPVVFPSQGNAKMGIRIPAGSNIILQMHYPAGSAGMMDSTEVRFFFYPVNETGIRQIYVVPLLQNWALNIPPNTVQTYYNACSSSGIFANCKFPFQVSVFAAFPHSHLLCQSIVNYAHNNGDTIPLIRINRWDFHWQGFYTFKKLKVVPANYKWEGVHVYDNTVNNPNNPNNPPQTVTAGEATTDEMLYDSFMLLFYQPGDEYLNIDSLLTVSIIEHNRLSVNDRLKIYPNPASDLLNVYTSFQPGEMYLMRIFDISGHLITEIKTQGSYSKLDISNLVPGSYILQVTSEKGQSWSARWIKTH